MKTLAKTLLTLGFASAMLTTTAVGQLLITFDEYGNGRITGGAAFGLPDPSPLPSAIAQDPISGLFTLSYTLPGPVAPGDLQLIEPGQPAYSDVIRFINNRIFFFSDLEPGELNPPPADVGLPGPNPTGPTISRDETGLFGNPYTEAGPNGFVFTPTAADPGFAGGLPVPVTYTIVSDGVVPEPGTLALLGLAGGLLAIFKRRQSARV